MSITSTTRRTAVALIGALVAVIGGVAVMAAAALLITFRTGALEVGPLRIATPSAAVVSDVTTFHRTQAVGGITGPPVLHLTPGSPGTFAGVAPAADVDRWLAGVAVDQVQDLTAYPLDARVVHRPGAAQATPPAAQRFWVATATDGAELAWPVRDGAYRIVVMRSDGGPGVVAQPRLRLDLPNSTPIAIGILVASLLVTAGGVTMTVRALTRR